ncbi:TorD/DmsD family molecular chaperone [Raoultibacter phocaeensis]|uniref:TorD/DmsD family molecular chaperone n=1 Tax=Raoultibacter phocaeensis TaxID=2479841 RepID=UPI001119D258|nr:molecular chaperone TorD family protein [Raoultibacter phocaeensis]
MRGPKTILQTSIFGMQVIDGSETMEATVWDVVFVARMYLYRAFQTVFGDEPTEALLETLFSDVTDDALDCFRGAESGALESAICDLGELKNRFERDKAGFLERAKRDFAHVLVGPHELKAPPWECVYLTKERVLFQEATLKVREAYRSENMLPSQYPRVSDDHIAIELDFMAKLSEKSCTALEAKDREECQRLLAVQRSFVREHLLAWVSAYAADVAEDAPGSLYACAGSLMAAFLPVDDQVLGELLDDEACG